MRRLLAIGLFWVLILGIIFLILYKNFLLERFSSLSSSKLTELRLENESLKSQLNFPKEEANLIIRGLKYKPAVVYSTYPYSNQKLIGINLGLEDGITRLMPVAVEPEILLGQVIEAFPKYSLVRTIFDQEFKIPVRIGWFFIDALLEGGNQPMVTMIKKDQNIASGDAVYSAGIEFPYGMKIGTVGSIAGVQDVYFKTAEVKLIYNLNDIKKVYVITNYVSK